ncbi:MAG: hypothetical protein AAGJ54_05250 [Planctomycetota bacterium]
MHALLSFAAAAPLGFGLAAAQPEPLGDDYIGRQIARVAIIDYRLQADPGPDDARAGAMMLELAAEFRPEDPILLRYLVEAYRSAGDERSLIDATKRLYDVDPGDEVAQLRLISWHISRRQTVEGRLAAYGEWLDGRGAEHLEDFPAVASRLALDAALLYRETGDEQAFLGRLAQATRLDSTNKEAAALAAAVFAQRSDDPVARLEFAINLLLADPVDPNLHLSIAEQLAAFGVFDQSRRFFNNANRLYRLSGANADTPAMISALVALDWYTVGPRAILQAYETQLRTRRAAAKRRIDQLQELGQPTQDEVQPEDVRLDIERERFRLHAAVAVDDRIAAERSIADLDATTQPVLERLSNRLEATGDEDRQERLAIVRQGLQYGVATIVARLLADVDTRSAQASIDALVGAWGQMLGGQADLLYAAARYRNDNNPGQAVVELEPFAQQTALGAYFYASALAEIGRTEEAIEQFQRTADAAPIAAIGVLASAQAERLRGQPASPPVNADAIRSVAEAVPAWIDQVTAGPRNYMRLSARVESPITAATGETILAIEMRNLLPKPIGVGGDRPVGTRMAISPDVDVASHQLRGQVNPEVIDAHRKLRLEPGEASSIRVWPDAGTMSLLTETKAGHRVRARFNVLQSFVVNNGPFQRGPLSLTAESPLISRTPLPETIIPADELIRYVQTAEESDLLTFLPACRAALADADFPSGQMETADAEALARVLADRYPRLSRRLRAAVIAIMPPLSVRPELATLDQTVVGETDQALQRFALLTRAVNTSIPELVAAAASDDPNHAWFADYLTRRLNAEGVRGYAFLQPFPSHLGDTPGDDEPER